MSLIVPKPDKIFFFAGAVAWLPAAVQHANSLGIPCHLFACTRHLEEIFGNSGKKYQQVLDESGIPYTHCDDVNASAELKELVTDNCIGIGIGEAYTFNTDTLACFNRNVFDFMTIRMPRYRGGAHFTWQILKGSKIGAWCIQLINEAMIPGTFDDAPVIKKREYALPDSTLHPADYFFQADEEGLFTFKEFIEEIIASKEFQPTPLDEKDSLYLPRLYTLKHGYINWQWTGEEIERFINAFDKPYAGASTFCNGKKLFLKSCRLEKEEEGFHPFMAGLIYRIFENKVFIAAKDACIVAEIVNDETGENIIEKLKTGYRFFTPQPYLEDAMLFNAEFDAGGLKST